MSPVHVVVTAAVRFGRRWLGVAWVVLAGATGALAFALSQTNYNPGTYGSLDTFGLILLGVPWLGWTAWQLWIWEEQRLTHRGMDLRIAAKRLWPELEDL